MSRTKTSNKKSKPEEVDVNLINPDEHMRETVALQILGRTLASYASRLTNDEKLHYEVLYQLLMANRKPSSDLPEIATMGRTQPRTVNRYTSTEVIDEFIKRFPNAAQPLIALKAEKHETTKPTLTYGLKQEHEPDSEYMINLLMIKLDLTRGPARALYEKIIEPEFRRQREESGLVTITMKD